jgi:ABC-2 type transport system permease protein
VIRVLLPLLLKTWRDRWRGLIAWTTGLVLITVVELYVYPTIRDSGEGMEALIEGFPEPMQEIFRMSDYTSGAGFLNVEMFSIIVPLVFIAVGASWGAGATADEEEKGTADLLFTLPVSRTAVLLTKGAAAIIVLLGLTLVLAVTLVVGSSMVDLGVDYSYLIAACVMSGMLGVLYAGIGFLIGAATGRRGVALGVAFTLAIAGFLLYSLSPMVDGFERVNPVNPFQWAVGSNALTDGIDVGYALRLLLLSIALFAGSVLVFRRRDIRAE